MINNKKIIIGLAGEMSSGKTTVAQYILEKNKGVSYRFSAPLTDIAERAHIENTRTNLQKLSTMLRKGFGEDLLAKILFNDVQKDDSSVIIVDGVRRKEDMVYLDTLPEFVLLFVEAPLKERYLRLIGRNEKADDTTKSFEEFSKEQNQESETEIVGLKKNAHTVIDNGGDLEALYFQVDNFLKNYATED